MDYSLRVTFDRSQWDQIVGNTMFFLRSLREGSTEHAAIRETLYYRSRRKQRFNWDEHIKKWEEHWQRLTTAEEFELLRRVGSKLSHSQHDRMQHLEQHLDAGELLCNCYSGKAD